MTLASFSKLVRAWRGSDGQAAMAAGTGPRGVFWGDLRRLEPVSRHWGWARGLPVDRSDIERFLARHAGNIHGRVLEIQDNWYTKKFGGACVVTSDVLHLVKGNPQATLVADLTRAEAIPSDTYDCAVITQTLNRIYDMRAALRTTPPTLQIARTNICNFKCVYCTDHRLSNDIPRSQNEGDTWQRLLRLIPMSETLSFHGISEFLVDPEFFDIVRRCAEAGASLFLNTNGSVCGPKYLEALGEYPGHLSVNFSLDAASGETFRRIRGADFDRVLRNIKTYVGRFEPRRDRTWLSLSFVVMKSNVHEMPDFVRLAKDLAVDAVKFYRLHEYPGLDWEIPTKDGTVFRYRDEVAGQFVQAFNEGLDLSRRLAEESHLYIELPARIVADESGEAAA